MYFKYFKDVMEHRRNIKKACKYYKNKWKNEPKNNLFLKKVSLTHDLSKYLPSEFKAYANYFYGNKTYMIDYNFAKAVTLHYKRNKHHWNHFKDEDMPIEAIKEMIIDWTAMGFKFGGTPKVFYLRNYNKFNFTNKTRTTVEKYLDLLENDKLNKCYLPLESLCLESYALDKLFLNEPTPSFSQYCIGKYDWEKKNDIIINNYIDVDKNICTIEDIQNTSICKNNYEDFDKIIDKLYNIIPNLDFQPWIFFTEEGNIIMQYNIKDNNSNKIATLKFKIIDSSKLEMIISNLFNREIKCLVSFTHIEMNEMTNRTLSNYQEEIYLKQIKQLKI